MHLVLGASGSRLFGEVSTWINILKQLQLKDQTKHCRLLHTKTPRRIPAASQELSFQSLKVISTKCFIKDIILILTEVLNTNHFIWLSTVNQNKFLRWIRSVKLTVLQRLKMFQSNSFQVWTWARAATINQIINKYSTIQMVTNLIVDIVVFL